MSTIPNTESELQLFRLLQRANVLVYYENFIQNGGDDVQQLYDAYRQSNDEFIEIMRMVGMTKPLHVRRLQKALREWGANPADFQTPLVQLGEIPSNGQLVNRPLPFMPYRGDLSRDLSRDLMNSSELPKLKPQTLLHSLPQTASLPSTSLSTPSISLPQLPMNSTINSPISQTLNPSLIPTTMSTSINPSISQAIVSTLNSSLTTTNSKMSTINSLIPPPPPPPINTNSPTMNSSSILTKQVPSCTITRSSISNLCKSPSTKSEPYNVQVNLMQPMQSQPHLPTGSLLNGSTGMLGSAFSELNTSLSNGLSALQTNAMNAFLPVHLNGKNHQTDACNSEHNLENFNANSPICMTKVLTPEEIEMVAKCARKTLEFMKGDVEKEVKSADKMKLKNQKKVKDVKHVLKMSEDDPRRMEEFRKYASIYGRFDCKRKPEKPLSSHETFVNEAALQLCRLKPILLTNRNLLLKLARVTVRLANYKYSKGHSRSQYSINFSDEGDSMNENLDNIEIEILEDENNSHDSFNTINGKSSSSESNRDGQALSKKPFSGLQDQNSKFILMSGSNGNGVVAHSGDTGSASNSNGQQSRGEANHRRLPLPSPFEEERRRRLDQMEMISRQIELNSGQIAELRMQLEGQSEGQHESSNENELLSKLLKLEDDQKLLIEEKNNLVNQIQKLHSFQTSPRTTLNFDSDSDDDTNSRQSIYSQESSRDGPAAKPSTPNHADQSQSSADLSKSIPSTLKRKLLESTSPQAHKRTDKSKADSGSDDENRADPDENIGIDLRIVNHSVSKSSKKR